MTEDQIHDLINRDVDGDLSPSEKRRLAQLLRRNAPARKLHAEISALGSVLSSVRAADPPANLGNRIRAAVHSRVHAPDPRRTLTNAFREFFQIPTIVRYGTVFAGGLVTGALLFMFLVHPQPLQEISNDVASGSILSRAETFPVVVDGATGTLVAVPTASGKELTLSLTCGTTTTTKLTYDPSRVKLDNVRDVQSAGGPVIVKEGIVQMTGSGSQRCTLSFSGVKDSRVTVHVSGAGGGSFRAEIQLR